MQIALLGLAGSGKTTVFNAVADAPVRVAPGAVLLMVLTRLPAMVARSARTFDRFTCCSQSDPEVIPWETLKKPLSRLLISPAAADDDSVGVALPRGRSRILMKCADVGGANWGFYLRVTDADGPGDTVPDDVVEYDHMIRGYQPRFGSKTIAPKQAVGLYLESPALHYSVGTRVTPKVAERLDSYKVPQVVVHADAPSFEPEMTRAMETLSHSDDWMVRLGGFHLKKGLVEAVHRARGSETHGTSFIPALAQGSEFGRPPKGVVGY
jgi:hypothetical protein